jgi:hypothetical protein
MGVHVGQGVQVGSGPGGQGVGHGVAVGLGVAVGQGIAVGCGGSGVGNCTTGSIAQSKFSETRSAWLATQPHWPKAQQTSSH